METNYNIKINGNHVIFDGHADDLNNCSIITTICNALESNDDFKCLQYHDGYAAFEIINKAQELRFAGENGGSDTASGENVGSNTASGDVTFNNKKTADEAISENINGKIYFTTDGKIVLNGNVYGGGGGSDEYASKQKLEDDEKVIAQSFANVQLATGLRDDLTYTPDSTNPLISAATSMSNAINRCAEATVSCAAVTTLSYVPVTYKLVMATISANASLALLSIPQKGREVHIIVKNSSSSSITITLPTASQYVNLSDSTLTVDANGYAEINCVSDGTKIYIRTA